MLLRLHFSSTNCSYNLMLDKFWHGAVHLDCLAVVQVCLAMSDHLVLMFDMLHQNGKSTG